ncbi:MAG: MMPL family transporter [Myxococcaceae bacterium]|nr:MMPL family transporter [Myxococcaceae bacterium]
MTARPRLTVAVSVALFLLGAAGLLRARFSTDYRIFFSKEDAGLASFQKLESVFTKTDNVLFVVSTPGDSVFGRETLAAIDELTREGWRLPYASRVDSVTSFPFAQGSADELTVRPLLSKRPAELDDAELETMRQRALDEPILVGSLLSRDARTAGVNVTLRLPREDPEEVPRTVDAARALVQRVKAKHPGLEVRATGMAFVNHAFMETSIRDMGVMIPLMLLVMLGAMALMLRSAHGTLAVAAVVVISATLAMALAGWLGYPLSPTSIAAPMIVLTVAIADGVHLVLATMENLRRGMPKRDAIVRSVRENLEAVTYTWLTTVVGFLCLNSSDAPPVLHLANMSSFGVTMAYAFSLTLLPGLCMVLPLRAPRASVDRAPPFFGQLAGFVLRHKTAVLATSLATTLGFGVLASRLENNDAFLQYFDAGLPFRQDVDFAMKRLSGVYRLEFQLGAGGPSQVTDPAYLERLDAFSRWLEQQPEVQHVYGLNHVLSRVHRVLNGDGAPTREQAAEALLLYTMQLPAGADLTDRVNIDQSASRLTVTVRDLSTRQMTTFAERSEAWLAANAPPSMASRATGPVVIFSALSERNARGMVQGDLLSLALISLCMVLVLRSVKLGLLSVVPNVIPIVIGYGVWFLAVGKLNVVGTIAGSISLGVIVDDTIHFLTRYKRASAVPGTTPEGAMQSTLAHVGPAMISTSLVLALGFGVLTLSRFQMTSHLGWLCVLIVGSAPLADLIVAPALVLVFTRSKAPPAPAPRPSRPPPPPPPQSFGLAAGKVSTS